MEAFGCLGEIVQVAGDARVRRNAVAEPLWRPMGSMKGLGDGGLQPVELEKNHVLRGVVSKREGPGFVSA
jgi:hypothetical protein